MKKNRFIGRGEIGFSKKTPRARNSEVLITHEFEKDSCIL